MIICPNGWFLTPFPSHDEDKEFNPFYITRYYYKNGEIIGFRDIKVFQFTFIPSEVRNLEKLENKLESGKLNEKEIKELERLKKQFDKEKKQQLSEFEAKVMKYMRQNT